MSWDEAREIVALVLALVGVLMALAPVLFRLIDGQYDQNGFRTALNGANPTAGLSVLGAAVLVATTPAVDVTPRLRRWVHTAAMLVCAIASIAVLDLLFADAAGGVRHFFTRFPTILRFSGPAVLLSATAAWLARRVVPFPAG